MFVMNLFEIVCQTPRDNEIVVLERTDKTQIRKVRRMTRAIAISKSIKNQLTLPLSNFIVVRNIICI